MTLRPKLRPYLQANPLDPSEAGGRDDLFVVTDPFKVAEPCAIPQAALVLATLMDGTRTAEEIAAEVLRRHRLRVLPVQVEELAQSLDASLLLDGPGLASDLAAYAAATVRPAANVGSYPGEPGALRAFLEAQWTREGGPGGGPSRRGPAAAPIRAFASPHIDLGRGGASYAHVWRAVAEECPADTFVVFGTSHTGTAPLDDPTGASPRFALTRKSFATPLGLVPTATDVVDRLVAAYDGPEELFAGELHHRREHSIEFQALWLQHLFGAGGPSARAAAAPRAPRAAAAPRPPRPIRIVPVLCGSLADLPGDPTRDPALVAFHRALRSALAPLDPGRVAFVAGIDLAHVGEQFGAPAVTGSDVDAVERADRELLRLATDRRDPDAVHRDIRKDDDARSVCGHAPLVATLTAVADERLDGELVRWDRWWDGRSAVSFAGAVWRATAPAAESEG